MSRVQGLTAKLKAVTLASDRGPVVDALGFLLEVSAIWDSGLDAPSSAGNASQVPQVPAAPPHGFRSDGANPSHSEEDAPTVGKESQAGFLRGRARRPSYFSSRGEEKPREKTEKKLCASPTSRVVPVARPGSW